MKKIFAIAALLIMAFVASQKASAEQAEPAVIVYTVSPAMHCQNCENKIKTNLRFEKGVSQIATNVKDNTIKITYDKNKTNPEKLAAAFEKIGYQATEKQEGK